MPGKKHIDASKIEVWDTYIKPNDSFRLPNFSEIWRYRDLARIFFVRDFITYYKQTVLGPIWYLIQPIVTTVTFYFIFSKVANLSTNGVPPILFYMSGIILWTFFAHCFIKNSQIFSSNAVLFSKVYFPRIVVPISVAMSGFVSFFIQFALLLFVVMVYHVLGHHETDKILQLVKVVPIVAYVSVLGIGVGLVVSALTVRFKDLAFLAGFMAQLWMYASPIIYPLSQIPKEFHWFFYLNPMTAPLETFRHVLFDTPSIPVFLWLTNSIITISVLVLGFLLFTKIENVAMDTV